jgi:KipI family sensor histidine kinase inhibitor
MRLRPYGPAAWLVDGIDDPIAWANGIRRAALDGVVEVVPAETTVLVRCVRARRDDVEARLADVAPEHRAIESEPVIVPVRYDGDDLGEVATSTRLSIAEVVARHSEPIYRVRFCGFSPGFGYLGGLDPALELPRRDVPRTRVPAGAVAIAAHYSAVYPAPSPGGWHLIGSTDLAMWDPARPEPSLLTPGATVTFRPMDVA